MLVKVKSYISVLVAKDAERCEEIGELNNEVASLKTELNRVKIVLADKVVELFQTNPSPTLAKPRSADSVPKTFADTVKNQY